MAVRRKYIRNLTESILKDHKIDSAPVPIDLIARRSGIQITKREVKAQVSGFLLRDTRNGRLVIGVNSKQHPNRQRFTVAHEIGHFLLHGTEAVHLDGLDLGFHVMLRDANASDGTDEKEVEANLFAAEILMPAKFLDQDLAAKSGIDLLEEGVLKKWAQKYKVSTEALTFRLANLGYVKS